MKTLFLLLLFPLVALAQGYPTKPVRIVLPFGPGGIADITTRTIAPKLSDGLGQQVVVENMPGAGGIRAAETVARAEPDGHTLLLLTNGNAVSQALFKSLPYDPVNDFAMISTVGYFSMVIVTRPESSAKTLQEAIAMAKANPGKMNIGTITPGGTQHLAGELFRSTAGIDALVVPHKTTGEVIVAARNGNVDLAVDFIAPLLANIKSGALRALAVTAGKRFPGLPDVPTAIEAGVAGYDVASWNAMAAPAKTPRAVVDRVNAELRKAIAAPDVQKRFEELGVEGRTSTPEQLRDFFIAESKRWSRVVETAKIPKHKRGQDPFSAKGAGYPSRRNSACPGKLDLLVIGRERADRRSGEDGDRDKRRVAGVDDLVRDARWQDERAIGPERRRGAVRAHLAASRKHEDHFLAVVLMNRCGAARRHALAPDREFGEGLRCTGEGLVLDAGKLRLVQAAVVDHAHLLSP